VVLYHVKQTPLCIYLEAFARGRRLVATRLGRGRRALHVVYSAAVRGVLAARQCPGQMFAMGQRRNKRIKQGDVSALFAHFCL
jgi:hypothetical protein